MLVYSQYEFI